MSAWQASDMYYLPPIRFWELLLGSALGYASLFRKDELANGKKRMAAWLPALKTVSIENVEAAAGLLLILIAIFALNEKLRFPGWWALLPTIGTALLISAGPSALINRSLLSRRPVVFIGLISYPLYLWHWPLISYAHIVQPGVLAGSTTAVAVALAFVLAWVTFRFIEKPLRTRSNRWAFACVFSLCVAASLGMAALAHQLNARSQSFGFERIFEAENAKWGYPGHGLLPVSTPLGNYFVRGTASSKVLFMGDSHVQQYYPRIDRLLTDHPNETKTIVFVSRLGCPPVSYFEGLINPKCAGIKENAIAVAENLNVDTVVLTAGWYHYSAFDVNGPDLAYQDLAATITLFRSEGRRVYLILPIPRGDVFAPSHLVKRSFSRTGFAIVRQIARREVDREVKPLATRLRNIANATGAIAVDPLDYICPRGDCPTFAEDGLPIYCDESHLRPDYVREYITYLDDMVLLDKVPLVSSGLALASIRK